MTGNNPVNNCQSNAGALKFFRFVKTLKYPEQLIRILHSETGAVVFYKKDNMIVFWK